NVAIDFRWANGRYDQLPALAAELVRRQAAVIFSATIQSALSANTATSTIPIVFAIGSDPVKYGLAASLSRPGGNATTSWLGGSILTAKRLELLHEAAPAAGVIGALVNPTNPTADDETREIKGSRPRSRAGNPFRERQRRARDRWGLCNSHSAAGRCGSDRRGQLFLCPARSTH